jgi:hypothetical protein
MKKVLFIISLFAILLVPVSKTSAADEIIDTSRCPAGSSICDDINTTKGTDNSELFGPDGRVTGIVNFMTIIGGIIAVFIFIYSGVVFVTSSGDSKKISTAKNSILYAAIGIVLVLIAQFITSFLLNTATG